ncbi:MAG: hypothetical protein IV100_28210 [Myxococcales bacterium]|nr:hypothetical protein [Myxococcales bacterium]
MPKINDDKKKPAVEKPPAPPAAVKKPAASGFAASKAAVKPKAAPVAARTMAPVAPKLSTFKSCEEPLARAIAASQSLGSGGKGSISDLARALEALRGSVQSTLSSADYVQKGDLATRMGLSNLEKHKLGNKADKDLGELEAILEVVETLSTMLASVADAALIVGRTHEVLNEARYDVSSLARTFGSEGFVLNGAAEPPKAASPAP